MQNLKALLHLHLNNTLKLFRAKNKPLLLLKLLVLLLVLGGVGIGLYYLTATYTFLDINFSFLALIFAVVFVLLFSHSLFAIIKEFYMGSDMALCITMPVNDGELFLSKLISLFVREIITNLILLAPIMIWFGISSALGAETFDFSAAYIFTAPIFIIFFPAVALTFAAILSVPIMFIIHQAKRRRWLKWTVSALIFAGVVFLYLVYINIIINILDFSSEFSVIMQRVNESIEGIASYLIILRLIAALLFKAKFFYTLFPIAIATLALLIFAAYYISKPYYFKLSRENLENYAIEHKTKFKKRSAFFSIIYKDALQSVRQPGLLFSLFAFTVLMPFLVVAFDKLLYSMTVNTLGQNMIIGAHLLILCIFATFSNLYAVNALAFEGSAFYHIKTMPMSYKTLMLAKTSLNIIATTTAVAITTITCIALKPEAINSLILSGLLAIILSAGSVFLNFYLNTLRPTVQALDAADMNASSKNSKYAILLGLILSFIVSVAQMWMILVEIRFLLIWTILFAAAGIFAVSMFLVVFFSCGKKLHKYEW